MEAHQRERTEEGTERNAPLPAADPEAFDRLVRPWLGSLLALCRRLAGEADGADLLQLGLLKAWRGLSSFRGETTFRAWLVGILFRLAAEPRRFRPRRRASALPESIPDKLDLEPLRRVTAREALERVEQAMERLPLRQRTVLHLRAVEGWSCEETARALGMSEGAVRKALFDARKALRARLGDLQ